MSRQDFAAQLSAVTGLDFTTDARTQATICVQQNPDELITFLFQQMGSETVKCLLSNAGEHVRYSVAPTDVDHTKFDRFHAWKTDDVFTGMVNTFELQGKIGIGDLKADRGLIVWANAETDAYYNQAIKTDRIEAFISTGADMGYDWRYARMNDGPNALVLLRQPS